MSESRVDGDLQARFQELRATTERSGRAPEFRDVLARAESSVLERPDLVVVAGGALGSRRWLRAGAWGSAALAATVAGLLLVRGGPSADEEFARVVAAYSTEISAAEWRSPTAGLLAVPGMDLMSSVPSIGVALPDYGALQPPQPSVAPRDDA